MMSYNGWIKIMRYLYLKWTKCLSIKKKWKFIIWNIMDEPRSRDVMWIKANTNRQLISHTCETVSWLQTTKWQTDSYHKLFFFFWVRSKVEICWSSDFKKEDSMRQQESHLIVLLFNYVTNVHHILNYWKTQNSI